MKSGRWILGFVVMVMTLRVVPALLWPVVDPSEGRYAMTAQRMADSGDWVTPYVCYGGKWQPFFGKPPLLNWLQSAFLRFAPAELAVRLPSLLISCGLLTLVWLVISRYCGAIQARRALLILVSTLFFYVMTGIGLYDPLLTAFVTGALLSYFAFSREEDALIARRWSLLVFLFLALGFMTKGPVAIAIFGLPVFLWTLWFKRWSDLKQHTWVVGILLFLGICVPWFILVERAHPGAVRYFFLNENLLRYTTHEYGDRYGSGHQYPRGTAIAMFLEAAFPWSFFLLAGIWIFVRSGRWKTAWRAADPWAGFWLFAFVSQILFWCLARQLLVTYLLPAVPAFSIWLAVRMREDRDRLILRTAWVATIILILLLGIGIFFVRHTSPKRLLARAAQDSRRVYFARRTPNSAYFYAPGKVVPHTREPTMTSLEFVLGQSDDMLLVLSDKYLSRVSQEARQQLRELFHQDQWTVFERKKLQMPEGEADARACH